MSSLNNHVHTFASSSPQNNTTNNINNANNANNDNNGNQQVQSTSGNNRSNEVDSTKRVSDYPQKNQISEQAMEYKIDVGSIIEVLPRTWPGINKQGGTAKVTKCFYKVEVKDEKRGEETEGGNVKLGQNQNLNTQNEPQNKSKEKEESNTTPINELTHVNVRYTVVGGSEKRVPIEYCHAAPQYDIHYQKQLRQVQQSSKANVQLRDRSFILGRCTSCGSLRNDCGSCDFMQQDRLNRFALSEQDSTNNKVMKGTTSTRRKRKTKRIIGSKSNNVVSMESHHLLRDDLDVDTLDSDDETSGSSSSSSNNSSSGDDSVFNFHSSLFRNRKSRNIIHDSSSEEEVGDGNATEDNDSIPSSETSNDIFLDTSSSSDEDNQFIKEAKRKIRQMARANKKANINAIIPILEKLKYQNKSKAKAAKSSARTKVSRITRTGNDYDVLQSIPVMKRRSKNNHQQVEDRSDDDDDLLLPVFSRKRSKNTSKTMHNSNSPDESSDDELLRPVFSKSTTTTQQISAKSSTNSDVSEVDITPFPLKDQNIGFVDDNGIGEKEESDDEYDSNLPANHPFAQRSHNNDSSSHDKVEDEYHFEVSQYDGIEEDYYFIQPEGENVAENLPSDILDKSYDIPFHELPEFFDTILDQLRLINIPTAKKAIEDLQIEIEKQITNTDYNLLRKKCYAFDSKLVKILIREGRDQLAAIVSRFAKKKQYRLHNINKKLSKSEWENIITSLDSKLDLLNEEIESLMKQVKHICEQMDLKCERDINTDDDTSANDTFYVDDREIFHEQQVVIHTDRHPHARIIRAKKSRTRQNDNGDFFVPGTRRRSRKAIGSTRKGTRIRHKDNLGGKDNKRCSRTKNNDTHMTELLPRDQKRNKGRKRNGKETSSTNHRKRSRSTTSTRQGGKKKRFISNEIQRQDRNVYDTESEKENEHKITRFSQTADMFWTECFLYNELKTRAVYNSPHANNVCNSLTIKDICDKLSTTYNENEEVSMKLLEQLPLLLENPHAIEGNAHYTSLMVFQTLYSIFKEHASVSLQEIIQTNFSNIQLHIKLLICVMRVLKLSLHSHLKRSDGRLYDIFSISGSQSIVEVTLLQLLDVIYSQSLPDAWGQARPITLEEYSDMKELCSEIAQLTHTIETTSSILLYYFQPQTWQKSTIVEKAWFVSSISSEFISKYWTCEEAIPISKERSRFSHMRKIVGSLPRREIEAIFMTFAFFASAPITIITPKTEKRWNILPSLFYLQSGVFRKRSGCFLLPCQTQLRRCQQEIRNLVCLLDSGCLDPLPGNDKILVKILNQSLDLDMESTSTHSNYYFMKQNISEDDCKLAHSMWHYVDDNDTSLAKQLLIEHEECTRQSDSMQTSSWCIFSLRNSSMFVDTYLDFVTSWIKRIPLGKKARWSRLEDAISGLIDSWREKSILQSNDKLENGNGFASDFSGISEIVIIESKETIRRLETAAMLHFKIFHHRLLFDAQGVSVSWSQTKNMTMSTIQNMWQILSNNGMKEIQANIQKSRFEDSIVPLDVDLPFIAMRVFSLLLLKFFETIEAYPDYRGWESLGNDVFTYVISCLLSSLKTECKILHRITYSANSGYPTTHDQFNDKEELLQCFNVLSCGWVWLSSIISHTISMQSNNVGRVGAIFRRLSKCILDDLSIVALDCLRNITTSILGLESAKICFQSCLLCVRHAVTLSKLCNEDNDMLGGLDDEMLLAHFQEDGGELKDPVNDLGKFLLQVLDLAKPSARFNIDSALPRNGKNICEIYAGEICNVLAALLESPKFSISFADIISKLKFRSYSTTDSTLSYLDTRYHSQSKQRFVVEHFRNICNFKTKKIFSVCEKADINKITLEAIVDASAMNHFPLSDCSIMDKIGISQSKGKEAKRMKKIYRYLKVISKEKDNAENDIEKLCLWNGKHIRHQEGLFTASHLWPYMSHLASYTMQQKNAGSTNEKVGLFCIIGNAIFSSVNERSVFEEYILGSFPSVSLECQCLRRLMMLRKIIDFAIESLLCGQVKEYETVDILEFLIAQMVKEMDTIAQGLENFLCQYDCTENYTYTKARILLYSYSQLFIAVTSFLVKQLSKVPPSFKMIAEFAQSLNKRVILPCFKKEICSIWNSSHSKQNRFGRIQNIFASDLSFAATNHLIDVIISAVHLAGRTTFFYEIVDAIFTTAAGKSALESQILTALNNRNPQSIAKDNLNDLIRISISSQSDGDSILSVQERLTIKEFVAVVCNVALRNIRSKDPKKLLSSMDIIGLLLKYCENIDQGFLDLEKDICRVLCALSHHIESLFSKYPLEEQLCSKAFAALKFLIEMRIKDKKILVWCQTEKSLPAEHILHEIMFLYHLTSMVSQYDGKKNVTQHNGAFHANQIQFLENKRFKAAAKFSGVDSASSHTLLPDIRSMDAKRETSNPIFHTIKRFQLIVSESIDLEGTDCNVN